MAIDEDRAAAMRNRLAGHPGITEKRMFGGLAFLLNGHMICGVHATAAMFRVGKAAEAEALTLPGVAPMAFTGRPMGGFVEARDAALDDPAVAARLYALALAHAAGLPPK